MKLIPKESHAVFEFALSVRPPWQLTTMAISKANRRIDVGFHYSIGNGETCPFCGKDLRDVFFSSTKRWTHLNFFQYETHMSASIPVFRCSNKGCIASVEREAILNTIFLDVLLMVSPFDSNYALGLMLTQHLK
ncbi:transposase family protein [Geomonas sp. RF6]|uniref:transposase family protein n=1 Tax=Geomonas sp. RF6 TaxID=2897342 RepID=UPI001E32EFA9|nr:transposase family protein [Geomonas sp. RF6]UFS68934.1 transposase family protein [Geomonas sp. RF6]